MKKISLLIGLLICISLYAEVKLIESYQVGLGSYYRYYEDPAGPWRFYVIEMDVSNPYNSLKVVKANDSYIGKETVKSMALRNQDEDHRVVGATNGDFYDINTGETRGSCVVDGQFVKSNYWYKAAFACSNSGVPMMIDPANSTTLIMKDSLSMQEYTHPVTLFNKTRSTNYMCIYNSFMGSSTNTNSSGFECLVRPVKPWSINDTIPCIIEACELNIGNMAIPKDKIVISGHGTASDFLNAHCRIGDTLKVVQSIHATKEKIKYLVGGGPTILLNNQNVVDECYEDEGFSSVTCTDRHPRTALGYNEDSTHVYFVVVDGRQAESVGMTLYELSDFMIEIGIVNGMNIDGGGSSTLLVRNSLVNSPSDGSERADANGIMCITTAPQSDLAHIQIPCDSLAVFKNRNIRIGITGWDESYNPKALPSWDSMSITYDPSKGVFNEDVFTASEADGDFILKADYQGDYDSVKIHIVSLTDLDIYPETVTIDSVNGVEFEVKAVDEAGSTSLYDNDIFEFTVLDPAIASVDSNGAVIGKVSGETKVIVRYGDQSDTAIVKVEIGEGEVVVDEIESIDGWSIDGDSYINMSGTSMSLADRIAGAGSKAVKVDYERSGDEDGMITIACDPVNIYGVPSYILVDVLADSQKNWIYIDLQDARGVDYSVKCSSSLRYNDGYRTQYLDMANLLPSDGDQLYPLKVTGMRLRIDDKATTGSMYIDRIRLIYPGWTAIDDPVLVPETHSLSQNYPNPFNPVTVIEYQLASGADVNLSVFDLKGEKVKTLVSGLQNGGSHRVSFDASMLPGGVYFYRLQAGNWCDTRKMLLIK